MRYEARFDPVSGAAALVLVRIRASLVRRQYDTDKPIQITGTVTKVEWTNPHVHFYVDVKNNQGEVVNWNIELGPPLILRHLGWRQDSLKPGDQVTVEGYLARDQSNLANAKKVTLADGRSVFAGSSVEKRPE